MNPYKFNTGLYKIYQETELQNLIIICFLWNDGMFRKKLEKKYYLPHVNIGH